MDPASQPADTGWARYLERKNICQILVGNLLGLELLGRSWLSRKDNVKMDLKKYDGVRVWNGLI